MHSQEKYKPKNKIRIVTAASLFDGHDAAINIMRRMKKKSQWLSRLRWSMKQKRKQAQVLLKVAIKN